MDDWRREWITSHLERSIELLGQTRTNSRLCGIVLDAAKVIADTFRNGGKVLLAGNGGSAADAQHMAGEFLSRFHFDRAPLPAIALTTDSSVLTAVANDYCYEKTFARQILGLGSEGDTLIVISTSGRSQNVLEALGAGRRRGMYSIAMTGSHTQEVDGLSDLVINVPSTDTPLIQQVHITLAHVICGLVEHELFKLDAKVGT